MRELFIKVVLSLSELPNIDMNEKISGMVFTYISYLLLQKYIHHYSNKITNAYHVIHNPISAKAKIHTIKSSISNTRKYDIETPGHHKTRVT